MTIISAKAKKKKATAERKLISFKSYYFVHDGKRNQTNEEKRQVKRT